MSEREAGTFAFPVLIAFLCLVFLTGGGSRPDIQSLVVLRPVSVLVCAYGIWHLKPAHIRDYRVLLVLFVGLMALALLHLVPLPPAMWKELPGRQLIVEIDQASRAGEVWRPLSLVPSGAWNAFYSMFVPMAVLLLAVQLDSRQRRRSMIALLCLGLISGLVGLLQSIGDPNGTLYFYRLTNNGAAVGLFSNRNHQGILLAIMFPVLAIFASSGIKSPEQLRFRSWLAIAATAVLIPLLLVTGSRAGLLIGIAALVLAGLLYQKPSISQSKRRKVESFNWRIPAIAFGILCMVALSIIMARAEAIKRLFGSDGEPELRFQFWGPIAEMAKLYFPFGSGVGSFAEVYRIHEPDALLNKSYLNHAHNDWLELVLTAGLPGLLLLAAILIWFVRAAFPVILHRRHASPDNVLGCLGAVVIIIFAAGSIGDYPLRVPSLDCVFVLALVWLQAAKAALTKITGDS